MNNWLREQQGYGQSLSQENIHQPIQRVQQVRAVSQGRLIEENYLLGEWTEIITLWCLVLRHTVVSVLQTVKQLFSLDSHLLLSPGYLVLPPSLSVCVGIYQGQWQSALTMGTPAVPSSLHPSPLSLSFQCQLLAFQKNLFQDCKLKRHPGVQGTTKVGVALKIISNIRILRTMWKKMVKEIPWKQVEDANKEAPGSPSLGPCSCHHLQQVPAGNCPFPSWTQ